MMEFSHWNPHDGILHDEIRRWNLHVRTIEFVHNRIRTQWNSHIETHTMEFALDGILTLELKRWNFTQ